MLDVPKRWKRQCCGELHITGWIAYSNRGGRTLKHTALCEFSVCRRREFSVFSLVGIRRAGSRSDFLETVFKSCFCDRESLGHEVDHSDVDQRFAVVGVAFVVFAEASPAGDPTESTFDDPAFGKHNKVAETNGTEIRLQNPTAGLARPVGQAAAAIRGVGEDHLQASELVVQFCQQPGCSVLILNRGRMHHDGQHQSQRIDGQMSFAAEQLFPGVVAPLTVGHGRRFGGLTVDDRSGRSAFPR